jgi:hypothetical protein
MTARWSEMSFGLELELGDVDRTRGIPPELGSWDMSERDIVNRLPPYRGVCADPLGENPPVGGEVNVAPSRRVNELAHRAIRICHHLALDEEGTFPTISCMAHTHLHVHVPGLVDDMPALRRITEMIRRTREMVDKAHGYRPELVEGADPKVRRYLKLDGNLPTPDWRLDGMSQAESFDEFIWWHLCSRDGQRRGRPFRHAVNTYSLRHMETIEFRFFRGTLEPRSLNACFEWVRWWMLSSQGIYPEIDIEYAISQLPPMTYDETTAQGWLTTRHPESRGRKNRRLLNATQ